LRVSRHLQGCPACRRELERYRQLAQMMSRMERGAPPAELREQILESVSKVRGGDVPARLLLCRERLQLFLARILEPLALPATAGVLAAMLVFTMVYQVLGAGIPLRRPTSDSPTNLRQPARLEILAGFEMSSLDEMSRLAAGQHSLLVETTVGADGQASSYRVISGQVDPAVQRDLDRVLLFSRFRPQMNFGRPTSGGRVVMSFSQIRVRG